MIDQDAAREALLTVTQAEQDVTSLQVRRVGINHYMTSAYMVLVCVFPMTLMGQSAFAAIPALLLIAIVGLFALFLWALRGRTAARPLRVQSTTESVAAHTSATTVGMVLLISLLIILRQTRLQWPTDLSSFASFVNDIAALVFVFQIGFGIGLFIWLGRYLALFGLANLLAMLCAIWFAATPDQALQWLSACAAVQFAAGVYLAKFQKPE
jgi:hypothetical protein